MAVREFNGTTDLLSCGIGAASGLTYGTGAAIIKFSDLSTWRDVCNLHDSGNTFLSTLVATTNFATWRVDLGGSSETSGSLSSISTAVWYLVVVRKATGTATPRVSVYNYGTTSWAHGGGGSAITDGTAPGSGGTVQFSYQGTDDLFAGRVAARALWSNTLPWTADASGDTAIQSAGLHTAAASWLTANPTAFWLFNQASTGTPVPDSSTTGTATQTSITGTTVINGDDPPGFNFALSTTPQPTAVQAAGPWPCF